jgi:hypothetical protein
MKKAKADSWLLVKFEPPLIDADGALFGGPKYVLFGFDNRGKKIIERNGALARRNAASLIERGCNVTTIIN